MFILGSLFPKIYFVKLLNWLQYKVQINIRYYNYKSNKLQIIWIANAINTLWQIILINYKFCNYARPTFKVERDSTGFAITM